MKVKLAQRYHKTEYIKINISKAAVADKNPSSSSQKTNIVKYIISKCHDPKYNISLDT